MKKLFLMGVLLCALKLHAGPGQRVAVFDFEFAAVKDRVSAYAGEREKAPIAAFSLTRLVRVAEVSKSSFAPHFFGSTVE